jgi:hypothetical protein
MRIYSAAQQPVRPLGLNWLLLYKKRVHQPMKYSGLNYKKVGQPSEQQPLRASVL